MDEGLERGQSRLDRVGHRGHRTAHPPTSRLRDSVGGQPLRAGRCSLLPTAAFLFFLVPLGIMVVYSFGKRDVLTLELYWGWTIQNYLEIADSLYLSSIIRSLILSATATALCLVIGFPVAYYISRQTRRWQNLLLLAIMIPFWTSFLVRTYAWVNLLANEGLLQRLGEKLGLVHGTLDVLYTPTAIGIGLVYSYLPLMVFPLYVALERMNPAPERPRPI